MVIEDEPRPVAAAQPPGDWPEYVWRVACLQYVKLARTTGTNHQHRSCNERVGVLEDETDCTAAGRIGRVLQQPHALSDRETPFFFALGAHDCDVVAGRSQGLGLQPDSTVEGD